MSIHERLYHSNGDECVKEGCKELHRVERTTPDWCQATLVGTDRTIDCGLRMPHPDVDHTWPGERFADAAMPPGTEPIHWGDNVATYPPVRRHVVTGAPHCPFCLQGQGAYHTSECPENERRSGEERREAWDHPDHYGGADNPYETIKVLEAWMGDDVVFFSIGNAIKYISRAGKKDKTKTVEDLKKARWYLDHVIAWFEEHGDPNG